MPPPFRKACTNCTRSKRRCDLSRPICQRCRLRALDCCYVPTTTSNPLPASSSSSSSSIEAAGGGCNNIIPSTRPRQISNLEELDTTTTVCWEGDGFDPLEMLGMMEEEEGRYDWSVSSTMDMMLSPFPQIVGGGGGESLTSTTTTTTTRFNVQGEEKEEDFYSEIIVHMVKRIKAHPGHFATNGYTSFIHRALYQNGMKIPSVIRDVLGMCSLYQHDVDKYNRSLMLKDINQNARDLVQNDTFSGGGGLSIAEQLARTQALILYQIMRLFDGDIRLRAEAEEATDTLRDWIHTLRQHIQPPPPPLSSVLSKPATTSSLSSAPSDQTSLIQSWRKWVFAESLRRTVIIGLMVEGVHSYLKRGGRPDCLDHEVTGLSFYAQSRLWNARSEYSWRVALRECEPLPVRIEDLDSDIIHVQPCDVDDLGFLIVISKKGVDGCRYWAGSESLDEIGIGAMEHTTI